jgi:hypothetical protein
VLLSKAERNELFAVVQAEGIDPRAFELEHTDGLWKLTHRAWGEWFSITQLRHVRCTIGYREQLTLLIGAKDVPTALSRWLQGIKVEHEMLDLWETIGKDQPITELMEGQENTPFSEQEQERIAAVVADVLTQARETYELPEEELRLLEAKLDYLVDAARYTRRIDWLNIAVGAVAGAFAGGVLTPDVVHKVLSALGAGLGPLFGHPLPVLGP